LALCRKGKGEEWYRVHANECVRPRKSREWPEKSRTQKNKTIAKRKKERWVSTPFFTPVPGCQRKRGPRRLGQKKKTTWTDSNAIIPEAEKGERVERNGVEEHYLRNFGMGGKVALHVPVAKRE